MRKTIEGSVIRAAGIGFGVAVALVLGACGKKPPAAPPAPPPAKVSVVTLAPENVAITTQLPGRVVAYRTAEVRPQVSGIIQKRLFEEGGEVKAGQQLYQIDPAPYQAAYDSAKAMAYAAKQQSDRVGPLLEADAISRQDYDAAIANGLQAKAALDTARINLEYTKVYSPISGRISRSLITEGALVTANQPTALAVVQQLEPVYVDVTQPSSTLLRLKRELAAGQLHQDQHGKAQVALKLEDGSDYASGGTLQFSEVTVDEGTGSVTLRAVFPNPDRILLPGMFVHEQIEEGVRPDAILVPQQGVTHDRKGDPTAMVVKPDNTVEARQLVTDRAIGDRWLVTQGLAAGDRVIVEGLQFVKPGAPVTPTEFQKPPAPGAPPSPQSPPPAGGAPAAPAKG